MTRFNTLTPADIGKLYVSVFVASLYVKKVVILLEVPSLKILNVRAPQ